MKRLAYKIKKKHTQFWRETEKETRSRDRWIKITKGKKEREKRVSKRNNNTEHHWKFAQTTGSCPHSGPAIVTHHIYPGDVRQVTSSPWSSVTSDTRGSWGLNEIIYAKYRNVLGTKQMLNKWWSYGGGGGDFKEDINFTRVAVPRGLWEGEPLRWDRVGKAQM